MRKKILKFCLFFGLLLGNQCLFAQTKGVLFYEYVVNDKLARGQQKFKLAVYFSDNKSVEQRVNSSMDTLQATSNSKVLTLKTNKPIFLFKDFGSSQLILSDHVMVRSFLITDTLCNFEWKIGKESRLIANYKCTRAEATFRGRVYEAWFAQDVPIKNGPWKFCGLPGLIVKVSDRDQIFNYQLMSADFETPFDENIIAIPETFRSGKSISHREFMEFVKADLMKIKEIETNGSFSDASGTATVSIKVAERKEKF